MGARYLARRSQYMSGVPSGITFPKFMKPAQINEVKRRRELRPGTDWRTLIDEVILESLVKDEASRELMLVIPLPEDK